MKEIRYILLVFFILSGCLEYNVKNAYDGNAKKMSQNQLIAEELKERPLKYGFDKQVSGVINDSNVRVRKAPGLTAEVIGKLQKGNKLKILGRTLEGETIGKNNAYWFKINTDAITGWVYGEYVDLYDFGQNALPVLVPVPDTENDYEIIKNYERQQIEVILKSGNNRKLITLIPYIDYNSNFKFSIIGTNLFYLNRSGEIIETELSTGEKTGTEIYSDGCFAISSDKQYICVSKKTEELTKELTNLILATKIPAIYNLHSKENIKIKDFTTLFLADEIGIGLSIEFRSVHNRFEIEYNWDTPIALFQGYISLSDFVFVRTK